MNFDTRNNSALMKRAEQLRRWEESDTNREPTVPKNERNRRIRFSSGCVFLAACGAGDKDEVIRLLESGADINTANIDGLTALHQACIDDNLEMVEFLVEHGADINRQDNEGWTPLHATASCGFVSIARYLVENAADLTAINSDGELAIDLASTNAMADYLQNLYDELGIDCDSARQIEEQTMLNDAKKWLKSDASEADKPHPKTGATALHVAAAKGYTKVLGLLLAGRANVDKQDNDGWTPLHAAAHWGQKETAEMLIDAMADIDIKNYAGQTPIDVAEPKIVRFLEELKANNKRAKRRPSSQIRITDTIENHIETPTKLIRVEVKSSDSKETTTTVNEEKSKPPSEPAKSPSETGEEDAPWRRNSSLRTRSQQDSPPKSQVPDKEIKLTDSEVLLRRTQSFENDEKFYQKYYELRARIKANSCPILPATQTTGVISSAVNTSNSYSVQRSASLKDHRHIRKPISPPVSPNTPTTTPNAGQVRRSFVPPVRDEESETQRKAHAKRVRETRRSTQGVTLDEIKSAEELVKKKNLSNNNNNNNSTSSNESQNITSSTTTTSTITTNTTNTITTINTTSTTTTTAATSALTTNNNSTLKLSTTNNDRVPSIMSVNEIVAVSSDSSKTTELTKQKKKDDVSASYTINTPLSKLKDNGTSLLHNEEIKSSKINSNYTISPSSPQPPNSLNKYSNTTTTSIPSTITTPSLGSDDRNDLEAVSTSATINVPNSSNKKTEIAEELTKTASTTVITTGDNIHHENISINTESKNQSSLPSTTSVTTLGSGASVTSSILPSVELETNRVRDKRSLFDIDNSNSLTLAEKLRNEANKYNEASRSNNDITLFGLSKTTSNTSGTVSDDPNSEKIENSLNRKCDSSPSSPLHHGSSVTERRPSWRLKFDAGSKFKLEDASSGTTFPPSNNTIITSAPAVIAAASLSSTAQRRNNSSNNNNNNINNTNNTINQTPRPVSAPTISTSSGNDISGNDRLNRDSTSINDVTITLRRNRNNSSEDKENDKENDIRSAQATQAVIQRRRRPKRRSTGVVHLDMDQDIDPDKQDSPGDNDDNKESGSERTSRSRVGSTSSLADTEQSDNKASGKESSSENGELIDYKALWEAVKLENEKLKQQLKKKDEELSSAKAAVDRFANATSKNSLSELEKRERRAMERKLSEMEEELKQLDILKTENQRLKEENGALIRVISKLSK